MAPGNRGQRGLQHYSGGSRGRGQASTSRGGSYSSETEPEVKHAQDTFETARLENAAKRLKKESNKTLNGRGRGKATGLFTNKSVRFEDRQSDHQSKSHSPENSSTPATNSAMAVNPSNAFGGTSTYLAPSVFGAPSRSPSPGVMSPFGAASQSTPVLTGFGAPSAGSATFGRPSMSVSNTSILAAGSQLPSNPSPFGSSSTPFATPSSANPFSQAGPASSMKSRARNPFESASSNSQQPSGSPAVSGFPAPKSTNTASNGFTFAPQSGTIHKPGSLKPSSASNLPPAVNGASTTIASPTAFTPTQSSNFTNASSTTSQDAAAARNIRFQGRPAVTQSTQGGQAKSKNPLVKRPSGIQATKSGFGGQSAQPTNPMDNSNRTSESLAKRVNEVLRLEGVVAPSWPGWDIKDKRSVSQHERIKKYWNDYREYQGKVRSALIRANVIDNPDVPKKLSEAIDFKGTCEDMCPGWEKVDRIISGRVDDIEKEVSPDGSVSKYPALEKMVKALARSAAGQEAPLPDEVRSAAALRRTVDYLFGTVLANSDLPSVYTFLWDRTRAIRRDFVFHTVMNKTELYDQVDCLERIVRFHVTAAHQMSREGINTQGFSEQQELEQLGKALLSLMHAYEDCKVQGVECDNQIEFHAYNILWGARSKPGILEEVQNSGLQLWEHEEIQLAVSLVEALQTPWDTLPTKPRAETDIVHNAFSKFFSVIKDGRVSYTMACFAETFFNHVRFSFLRTLLKSYKRHKQQATDWTIPALNSYLHFDHEEEVVSFCESHGVIFATNANGVKHLSFDLTREVAQPSPPLKQGYSHDIVEKKRGQHSLTEAINGPLYYETDVSSIASTQGGEREEEESLFVTDNSLGQPPTVPVSTTTPEVEVVSHGVSSSLNGTEKELSTGFNSQPASIFDRMPAPKSFSDIFAIPTTTIVPPGSQPSAQNTSPLILTQPSTQNSSPSIFTQPKVPSFSPPISPRAQEEISSIKPASTFSFLQQSQPSAVPVSSLPSITMPPAIQQVPLPSSPAISLPQPQNDIHHATLDGQTSLANQTSPLPAQLSSPFAGFTSPSLASSSLQAVDQVTVESIPTATLTPSSDESALVVPDNSYLPDTRFAKLTSTTNWVALGSDGLMEQFIASQVELILHQAATLFMEEEAARLAREEDEQDAKEADEFRQRSLATKYINRWREIARLLSLKRRGRISRKARRDHAEQVIASKAAKSASLVEDFRASTSSRRRRESLASLLDSTGVLDGVHDSQKEAHSIPHGYESALKRRRSTRSTSTATSKAMNHRRGQSEQQNPLRRSLLSDPTYLQGGSRIHLIPDYHANQEAKSPKSGVATDYFRLKARGITTLPDGSPLASSISSQYLQKKRSLDDFVKPATPISQKVSAAPQSVPAKRPRSFANSHDEIQLLKARARETMAEERMMNQKRAFQDDEEELFERAKRVREQMDEGAMWYRQEIEQDTASRSVSRVGSYGR